MVALVLAQGSIWTPDACPLCDGCHGGVANWGRVVVEVGGRGGAGIEGGRVVATAALTGGAGGVGGVDVVGIDFVVGRTGGAGGLKNAARPGLIPWGLLGISSRDDELGIGA